MRKSRAMTKIGVGIIGFYVTWTMFGDSFLGWAGVLIFGGFFIAGVLDDVKP